MLVLKFGGTSVGTPAAMQQVGKIIADEQEKIVVLSAISGVTNQLVEMTAQLRQGDKNSFLQMVESLKTQYELFVEELFNNKEAKSQAQKIIRRLCESKIALSKQAFNLKEEKFLLAQGEIASSRFFTLYLNSIGIKAALIPALEFMRIDKDGEPDLPYLNYHLTALIEQNREHQCFITQGYICRNAEFEMDNLQRGGSDYTATLIGAAIKADEIQIWTDIDGFHNNDPRFVENTIPIEKISYREAAELAYFGAKILHPTCVLPAEESNIPIQLRNTFSPEATGTRISSISSGKSIAAISAKDNITVIKIRSGRMLMAYGFLKGVFEIFENYKTPIDMITTSEVAVSLTIDNTTALPQIIQDLEAFAEVNVEHEQSIICIVGDLLLAGTGTAMTIFTALQHIPIRMVSYGGSNNNISILISQQNKEATLKALNETLF